MAAAAHDQDFLIDAPIVIIVWADIEKTAAKYGQRGKDLYVIQDAAAAAENIFLAITALDLNSCWIGGFDEDKLKNILKLKNHQCQMVIMPIGYGK